MNARMQSAELPSPEMPEERKRAFRAGDRARLEKIRRSMDYEMAYREREPLISVIIPTFERAEMILQRALPSVLSQDYERWELLIIGDGIASNQVRLLQGIQDRRVFFYNLKTRGRYPSDILAHWLVAGSKASNCGLRVAKGRWITHLDDDDEYTPSHISLLLNLARKTNVEWAHGNVLLRPRGDAGEVSIGKEFPTFGRIAQASSLYHAALKTFRYNPQCWYYEYPCDWDLWERFLEAGVTHAHLRDVVAYYYNERPDMRQRLREMNADQNR